MVARGKSVEDVEEMEAEPADRFGPVPMPVRRLLEIMRTRALTADLGAKRISAGKDPVAIEFEAGRILSRATKNILTQHFGASLEFAWQTAPTLRYKLDGETTEESIKAIQRLLKALAEVQA